MDAKESEVSKYTEKVRVLLLMRYIVFGIELMVASESFATVDWSGEDSVPTAFSSAWALEFGCDFAISVQPPHSVVMSQ